MSTMSKKKKNERQETWSMLKSIPQIVAALVAVVSIVISVKSCQIPREALDNSKQQFLQINKPYILITPKKFDDGQYWKLSLEDKTVVKRLKYQIKNAGNVIASNLSLPDIMKIEVESPKKNEGMVTNYEKPNKVTLGPGDRFTLNCTIKSAYKTVQDAKQEIEFSKSKQYKGDTIQLAISYENDLEPTKKYTTVVLNRIHNDTASILKSEMLIEDKHNKE